ncbi:CD3324 family protein [Planococcus halocryophilus]|uniref:CD3324 family protein n=1 Tax=Planococcus halocryophilus TaxID=1215089 RepID=UPI001F0EF69B|nr:CD3324 family protein [Planococcus halocryophilus]MCH4827584.1 hypothetical protein [Planococcus halocryophilus]
MNYINAKSILPKEVLKLIQKYADGEYLYIPRIEGKEKSWGEKNETKSRLINRDREIYNEYQKGQTYADLSTAYFLSVKSIQRIVNKEKNMD